MKFSIQIFHDAKDDKGKTFRGVACYQGEAEDVGSWVTHVKEVFKDREDVKFGAFLPGWHDRIP